MSSRFQTPAQGEELLRVDDLKVHFPVTRGLLRRVVGSIKAVDGISFSLRRGETLGLVGESGCGKSTTGRALLRLYEPTSGRILLLGVDTSTLTKMEMRQMRRFAQMIFQDPYASLNPRMTVREAISEPIRFHKIASDRAEVTDRVDEILQLVGLSPHLAERYPHEFSGGQRQRIGIARSLAIDPEFILCDEPVSALDVSIQAQIVNLMEELQERLHLTYLFIAHDLNVVRHLSHRVALMYLGKIVEVAGNTDLYENPVHPYTIALLSAVPIPDPRVERSRQRIVLSGDIPSPENPPSGCRFHPRCPFAQAICAHEEPEMVEVEPDHHVACHLWEEVQKSRLGRSLIPMARLEDLYGAKRR